MNQVSSQAILNGVLNKEVILKAYLEKFFEPKSVAVIGASATPHKAGNDVIQNILANQYKGAIHLVNPKGGEILGKKVHHTIQELPDGIDLAIIILPAEANAQAIHDCAKKGIKAIVLAAGGFAEVDKQGEAFQEDIRNAIGKTGVRVIGPNTSGHTSTPHNFTSSFFPLGTVLFQELVEPFYEQRLQFTTEQLS